MDSLQERAYGLSIRHDWYIVINPCIGFGKTCVTVKTAKLLLFLVIWLPSWIYSTHRRLTKQDVPPLERLTPKTQGSCWNFVATCSRTRDMPGGHFTPASVAGKPRKKPLHGEELSEYRGIIDTVTIVAYAFCARDSICNGNSVRPSVRLSVCPWVDQSKTVEGTITQFSPYSSPIPLVFAR